MKTTRIAITAISAAVFATAGQAIADDNVFVRGKDKFLEVTEGSKNMVKGVGKDIGFGFRDAWRRVSSFVTGKKPQPEYPDYKIAPYTPPPYGYTSPQGTDYAPGYGPPIPYNQTRPAPVQGEAPYVVPNPPLIQPSQGVRQVPPPQAPKNRPPAVPDPQPPVTQPKPTSKPTTVPAKPEKQPKPQPEKIEVEKKVTTPTKPVSKPTTPTPAGDGQPPFAVPIPGKSGMVYSPFTSTQKPVDVRDIPSGTLVKDPYTNKLFRVP